MSSGAGGPIAVHDERLRRLLAALLVDPTAPGERRDELVAAGVPLRVWEQAQLSAARGGLSLAGGELLWAPAQLACGLACVPYVREHAALYGLEGLFEGGGMPDLPFFADLRAALARLVDLELKSRCSPFRPLAMSQIAWAAGAERDVGKRNQLVQCNRLNKPHPCRIRCNSFSDIALQLPTNGMKY